MHWLSNVYSSKYNINCFEYISNENIYTTIVSDSKQSKSIVDLTPVHTFSFSVCVHP